MFVTASLILSGFNWGWSCSIIKTSLLVNEKFRNIFWLIKKYIAKLNIYISYYVEGLHTSYIAIHTYFVQHTKMSSFICNTMCSKNFFSLTNYICFLRYIVIVIFFNSLWYSVFVFVLRNVVLNDISYSITELWLDTFGILVRTKNVDTINIWIHMYVVKWYKQG